MKTNLQSILLAFFTLATAAAHATTYYVDINRPNDTGNGESWETAKKVLQSAINLATTAGDEVVVTNGIYAPISTSNRAITIRSVNGADVTIIDGNNANRCATLGSATTHTSTVLTGFTLRNGRVYSTTASVYGGGSYGGTLNNCILSNNTVSAPSTAIHAYGGGSYGGTLNCCTLTGNAASCDIGYASGGGAYGSTLNNCTLTGNTASADEVSGGGSAYGTLNNCTLTGNRASGGRGTAYGGGSFYGTLNNCTVTSNTVYTGSGAYSSSGGGSSGGTLNNCTLAGNMASSLYDRASPAGGAHNATLSNCIIWGNTGGSTAFNNYSGATIRYSCTSPLPNGTGNISEDPMFVDSANGNFRLQPGSPCIDSGTNEWVVGTVDLDGNPRILGGTVDMGAYEGVRVTCAFSIDEWAVSPASQNVVIGLAYGELPAPIPAYTGYMFDGWFTEETGGEPVTADTIVTQTADHTLYGRWRVLTFGEAVNAPELEWQTGGDAPWFTQLAVSHDGLHAAQSGTVTHDQSSWLETTLPGRGALSFQWKVSNGTEAGRDWLVCTTNGAEAFRISGDAGWERRELTFLGGEPVAVRWTYQKDRRDSDGDDCGWLDCVAWTPVADAIGEDLGWQSGGAAPWFITSAVTHDGGHAAQSGAAGNGQASWMEGTVTGTGELAFWWKVSNGTEAGRDWLVCTTNGAEAFRISGDVDWERKTLTFLGGEPVVVRWTYQKDNRDSASADCGWLDGVAWTPIATTLGEAVNAPGLDWQSGGNAPWFISTSATHDGVHAAQSGAVGDDQASWMETTFTGKGELAFWWKVSNGTEEGYDALICTTNGAEALRISGDVDWERQTLTFLGGGPVTVRWTYQKDDRYSDGDDCGWLDEVSWTSIINTLGEAVDAPELDWQIGGDGAAWFITTDVSHDGHHAAQSGAAGDDQASWLETTLTGKGELAFWWKVSNATEEIYDWLICTTNGAEALRISGDVDWERHVLAFAGGVTVIRWTYQKDDRNSDGDDCGWLDEVMWTPMTETTPAPVPFPWLDQWAQSIPDYEALAWSDGLNGVPYWESYVAGLDPTDSASRFAVTNFAVNAVGAPAALMWSPHRADRVYEVVGKTNLTDTAWIPTNSATRFFKVEVRLP